MTQSPNQDFSARHDSETFKSRQPPGASPARWSLPVSRGMDVGSFLLGRPIRSVAVAGGKSRVGRATGN